MSDNRKRKARLLRFFLPFMLSGIVMLVQGVVYAAIIAALLLLHQSGTIDLRETAEVFPLSLGAASLAVGALFAAFLLRVPLRPLREIMDATDKIAAGDYSVRVTPRGLSEFRALGEKFNHMAEELNGVELLRSDFVNNFSHEFKTPIVSIRGFARMLRDDRLTEAERREYLSVIIEESERLASLSTNVLELSRLEKQTILSDRRRFNLSEQIRLSAAMLTAKWESKNVEIELTGAEIAYRGSEELLKQVWINLLDNAIKFSPAGGTVGIETGETADFVTVSVKNGGDPIPAEALPRIFDKFYQGDPSHAVKGNGLGLTIAGRVVALHGGTLTASSDAGGTVFTVRLPKE